MEDRALMVARVVYSLPEAMVLVSKLRAFGIDALAMPYHFSSLNWHMLTAVGGIEIHVPARRYGDAAALIADSGPSECMTDVAMFARRPALPGLNAVALVLSLALAVPCPILVRDRKWAVTSVY